MRRIDAIEAAAVLESDFLNIFEGKVAYFGEFFCHFDEHGGVASRAPEWGGGHIGAVGFEDNAIEREGGGDFDGFARVFERQDARKTDVPAAFDKPARHVERTRITVKDAGDFGKFTDDAHAIFVSLAFVNDDRHVEFACECHLHAESFLLSFAWHVLIMIIEPDLANGLDFCVGAAERAEGIKHVVADFVGMVRVCAGGGIDIVIFLRERGRGMRGFEAPCGNHQARDALRWQACEKLVAVFVECGIVEVCVCIKKHN